MDLLIVFILSNFLSQSERIFWCSEKNTSSKNKIKGVRYERSDKREKLYLIYIIIIMQSCIWLVILFSIL